MFAKLKSKLKAALKDVKAKRDSKEDKPSSAETPGLPSRNSTERAADVGLGRPHGLGGRKSLDNSLTGPSPAAAGYPAGLTAGHVDSGAQQQQQALGLQQGWDQQQQQQQLQHTHGAPAHACSTQQPHNNCAEQCEQGSPGALQDFPAAAGSHASTPVGGTSTSACQPDSGAAGVSTAGVGAPGAAAAKDTADVGSASGTHTAAQHSRPDASRTPRDEDLGTCPPYAAQAVWGLRYTMEDKWAAVPNLIQIPLVLTCPSKKPKGSKAASGCGCMLPAAASKVLAKVSPSSRSSSTSSKSKDAAKSAGLASTSPAPGLEKASPDRQRLIGQGVPSSDAEAAAHAAPDTAAAAAAAGAAGAGAAGGVADSGAAGGAAAGAAAAAAVGPGPQPGMDALHYFGVFDGHGGADAARHCAQHMHQVVCSTILSMLGPEVAAEAVVSALATSSRPHATQEQAGLQPLQEQQQQQAPGLLQQQQQGGEAAAPPLASTSGQLDTTSTTSSSNTASALLPAAAHPAIDIAASNGSWLLPALSRSFVSLDHEFGNISKGSYVGSTAVVVLIGSTRLWVAHCGDSRAVLGRGGAVQVLTSDHKASRDDEVARVQAAGGHVWWDRVMGELAVSRAIGDHCLRPYVIPEPELLMLERTPEDEVLVMASDGLWDVVSNQEAVDMALHSLQAAQASGHTGVSAVKRSANALTKAALERGTRDNVTVLVINLRPQQPGSCEAAAASAGTGSHASSKHSSSSSRRHASSSKGHSSSKSSGSSSRVGSSSSSKKASVVAPTAPAGPAAAATPSAAPAAAAAAAATLSPAVAATQPGAVNGLSEADTAASHTAQAAVGAAVGTSTTAEAGAGDAGAMQLERAASGSETRGLMQHHELSPHAGGI